jgi:signal transduction histidine kinase/ActR/RegA family two-component response regulator
LATNTMDDKDKPRDQLINELAEIRRQLVELNARQIEHEQTEQKKLETVLSRHKAQLRGLTDAAIAINASLALAEILKIITDQARQIIGTHQAVTSFTANKDWAQAINSVSLSEKYAVWSTYDAKPDGSGIYALVCKLNKPMRMTQQELEAHPAWRGFSKEAGKHPPMRGWLAVPLIVRSGKNIGIIQLSDKHEGEFTEQDEAILTQLAQMASTAIENAELYKEALEANRIKDEFVATISHELRTPLTSILGWIRLLRSGHLDDEAASRALETIDRNAKSQSQLIEDLLDISRIITGNLRLNIQLVDLDEVINAAIGIVRPAADTKGIRVQTVFDSGIGPISGDFERLQQIIWNLLSNAIKFTPKGGRVQIRLERINSQIELTVSDTGQGIKADFLPHIFERFRQADYSTPQSRSGLGLGLAIVRHLVEQHGGTIQVHSDGEGQGATFKLLFPVMVLQPRPYEPGRVNPKTKITASVSFNYPKEVVGLRVLVVDDEFDTRELLSAILDKCDMEVKTASCATEAMDIITYWQPDILISDIGMPVEDGYELIRKVRANGLQFPAIALTAYARVEDRMRVLSSGFQMHLPKPVEPAELLTVIASVTQNIKQNN